ncbi:MAG: AraC family transcriptional regulator [Roseburia sp.]|nr:AraC family transcriptional regulator [Roseburia sp.]
MESVMSEYFVINKQVRETAFKMNNTHSHNCYEFMYLLSGECNILLNHRIYKMQPGSIVIIPPGEIHKSAYGNNAKVKQERAVARFSLKDIDWLCSVLDKEIIYESLTDAIIEVPEKRRDYVENLIMRIIYEYGIQDEFSAGEVKTLFQELILFFIRCRRYGENAARELDAQDSTIQEIATYIYENFEKPIYLDDVAKKFNISRSYLSKKFKATTGMGFKEYLLNVRIKEACRRLLETNGSITEIAFACGFNDSNYFGDAFRRIKGISPNKYRHNKEVV